MAKGARGGKGAITSAAKAKDWNELRAYAQKRGTTIAPEVENLRFEDVRTSMAVVDELAQHFGVQQKDLLKSVGTLNDHVMSSSFAQMYFNPAVYDQNQPGDIETRMNRVVLGYRIHPANQTQASTTAHEVAHLLENQLYRNYTGQALLDALHRGTEGTSVLHEALNDLNATRKAAGLGKMKLDAARATISSEFGNAMINNGESLAEAFADVYANKKNAGAYSQAVWRAMERRFGVQKSWLD